VIIVLRTLQLSAKCRYNHWGGSYDYNRIDLETPLTDPNVVSNPIKIVGEPKAITLLEIDDSRDRNLHVIY
jgi:hypothetical protein